MEHSEREKLMTRIVLAGAACCLSVAPLVAQSDGSRVPAADLPGTENVKAFIAARVQRGWSQPKTPWGDADISGVFTTKDEANTPFERPEEWAGRRMDEITSEEFTRALAARQQGAVEFAPFFGGGEPGSGVAIAVPIHWFDNLQAKNSRPWFVVDPPEGTIPPATGEGKQRAAQAGFAARAQGLDSDTALRGGRRDTYLDRYLGDRCIVWGSGVAHVPNIYGNSFQILQPRFTSRYAKK
jgi:hypothetical protein